MPKVTITLDPDHAGAKNPPTNRMITRAELRYALEEALAIRREAKRMRSILEPVLN